MASLSDIRATQPEYNDLSDQQLADGLYKKFYSDMPRDQFDAKVGLNPAPVGQAPHVGMGRDVSVNDDALAEVPGAAEAFLLNATNPVGISDEIGGVIQGGANALTGGSFTEGYNQFTDKARGLEDAAMKAHPGWSIAGQVAGSAPLMIAGPAVNLLKVGPAAAGASLAARAGNAVARGAATLGNAAITGGAYGEGVGMASETGNPLERATKALPSAGIGAAAGALYPIAGAAIRGAGAVVGHPIEAAKAFFNPDKAAAASVVDASIRDAGSVGRATQALEAAHARGAPLEAMDLGAHSRALARTAADISPEAEATLNVPLNARRAGQVDRVQEVFDQAVPNADSLAKAEALKIEARAANAPLYRAAYDAGDRPIISPKLEQLTGSPAVIAAMKTAATKGKDIAIAEGMGAFNPGVTVTPDGRVLFAKSAKGVPTYPNLQFWDYTKRALDDAAKNLKPGTDERRVAEGLSRQLRAELDHIVPEYGAARGSAAKYFGQDDALAAGETFAGLRSMEGMRAARKYLATYNDPEKKLFAIGYATKRLADLGEKPDNRSIVNYIFNKPAERQRFALALGEPAAREMEVTMRLESIMDMGKEAVQGNSKTARYLARAGAGMGAAGVTGVGVGVMTGQADPLNPKTWLNPSTLITAALTMGAIRGGRAATKSVRIEVANRVARMYASGDPRIVEQAVQIIGRSPSLLSALRRGQDRMTRLTASQFPALGRMFGRLNPPAFASGPQPSEADQNSQ